MIALFRFRGWCRIVLVMILAVGLLPPLTVLAQEQAPAEERDALTSPPVLVREAIEQKAAQVEKDTALADELRARLLELYRQTLDNLKRGSDWQKTAAGFAEARTTVPEKTAKLKAELAEKLPEEKKPAEKSLAELEAALAAVDGDLAAARKLLNDLEEQERQLASRRLALPQQIAALRQAADQARREMSARPAAGDSADLEEARRWLAASRRQRAEAEAAACEQEMSSFDVRLALQQVRRELQARQVAQLEKRQALYKAAGHEKRRQEAEAAARKA